VSDREGAMSGELREAIRRMDWGLRGVEDGVLSLLDALGVTRRRCRAALVFDRLKLDVEYLACGAAEMIRVRIDNQPLHEVDRDGD
jgi:hypothetical protein